MSSLALFDSQAMMVGSFLLYAIRKKIDFMSVMKSISLIALVVACFTFYFSVSYKGDLHEFLMLARFIHAALFPAILILPSMFCFSITHERHHDKLTYFTPLAIAFAGLISFYLRKLLISSGVQSCFIYIVFLCSMGFLSYFFSGNIKYRFFKDEKKIHHSISKLDTSIMRLALFLCGFLLSGGIAYTLYFSASYLSEVHIINLPAQLSPLNVHCFLLILLLPVSGYLYTKLGLLNIMHYVFIGLVIQAAFFFFNPDITPFKYMIFRGIFAVTSSLMLAPLFKVIYGLSNKAGDLYIPILWTVGGFAFSLVARYVLFLQLKNASPYFAKSMLLLAAILAFIALVPKINRLLGNENNA
jgi:hypothetical protein